MTNKKRILLIIIMLVLAIFLGYNGVFQLLTDKVHALNSKDEEINEISLLDSTGSLVEEKDVSNLSNSGINGDNYTFDPTYYPYYGLLDTNEQSLYRQIYANAVNLSNSFVPSVTISSINLANAMEAVYNDHPELFWIDTKYSYKFTETGKCVQVTLKYNQLVNNLDDATKKFNSITNTIINNASNLSSDYEKEIYVHDTILALASYQSGAPISQSAYSALVNGKTVCAGYARAFQYIMTKLNIPTYYVVGYAGEAHGWNIVYLDGVYYNVDLTWDDANQNKYAYFNKTDAELYRRKRAGMSIYLPKCNATSSKTSSATEYEDSEIEEITTPIIYVIPDEELNIKQEELTDNSIDVLEEAVIEDEELVQNEKIESMNDILSKESF